MTAGTVYARSKVALNKWLLARHLLASPSGAISVRALQGRLGVSYKTAWSMVRRLNAAALRDARPSPSLAAWARTLRR